MSNRGDFENRFLFAGAIAAVIGLYFAIDYLLISRLPFGHKARATLRLSQPIDVVFALIQSMESQPKWDPSIERVITQSPKEGIPRRKALSAKDSIHMYDVVVEPPTKLVRNMASHRESWVCEWTFALSPDGGGTKVVLAEVFAYPSSIWRHLARRGTDPLARVNHQLASMARALSQEPRITDATCTVIRKAADVETDRM